MANRTGFHGHHVMRKESIQGFPYTWSAAVFAESRHTSTIVFVGGLIVPTAPHVARRCSLPQCEGIPAKARREELRDEKDTKCTLWVNEIDCVQSGAVKLVLCGHWMHASRDVREPISLHQTVHFMTHEHYTSPSDDSRSPSHFI